MVEREDDGKVLHMFYGRLNHYYLTRLVEVRDENGKMIWDRKKKLEVLMQNSIPLTLKGWSRVFGAHHATIQDTKDEGEINSFGVYLTRE